MITEASRKANKLHIMHSAKQIAKEKDSDIPYKIAWSQHNKEKGKL